MKAIRVTCPNCNATLRVAEGAATVTCEYCGTPSAVQRRTRILERVGAPPVGNLPRAIQRHTKIWIIFAIVMALLPVVIAIVATLVVTTTINQVTSFSTKSSTSTATSKVTVVTKRGAAGPTWQGTDGVLVVDVTGDGTPELVGRGRRVNEGDRVMLLALDLATGTIVWEGPSIGTYGDTYRGQLSLAGDLLVYASYTGEVRAFGLDGKERWKAKLDERIAYFCAAADASLIDAVGADDVIRPLAKADGAVGAKREVKRKGRADLCEALPSDSSRFAVKQRGDAAYALGKKLDLHIDEIVRGPGGRVVGGAKTKGTRVTTIARIGDDDSIVWRQTAAADGLGAEGAPRTIVVGDRETCIIYYGKDYRTACFALADGKRLWDEPTPSFFKHLVIVGRSLIVTGSELRVHELDTGAVRWKF